MGILDGLEAILKLGLPMMAASWLAFSWLHNSGEINGDANHKDFAKRVKKTKRLSKNTDNKRARFLLGKWGAFGSGFYGLAGCWTFIVIEAGELWAFIRGGGFTDFVGGSLLGLIIDVVVSQISNFVTAFLWFSYWPGPSESIWLWILIAFLGYRVGIELARGRFASSKLAE
jgi:hypothetical protein